MHPLILIYMGIDELTYMVSSVAMLRQLNMTVLNYFEIHLLHGVTIWTACVLRKYQLSTCTRTNRIDLTTYI